MEGTKRENAQRMIDAVVRAIDRCETGAECRAVSSALIMLASSANHTGRSWDTWDSSAETDAPRKIGESEEQASALIQSARRAINAANQTEG